MGWIPDVPSQEDLIFQAPADVNILPNVDLRPGFKNKVEDQGSLGSCTANACVSNLEYLIAQLYKDNPNFSYPELARLFAYYEARKVHGLHTVDRGSSIRACVQQLSNVGICIESLFPYFYNLVNQQPPTYCYDEASRHRVYQYERLTDLNAMLVCLTQGNPFVFGFMVYSDSMRQARITGVMPMPSGGQGGGHAVLAVGYDLEKEMFLIRNSYGENFGLSGYYWMPFSYVTDPNLSADWWSMQAVKWVSDA